METASSLPNQRKRVLLGFTVFLLLAAGLFAAYWLIWGRYHISTDNAYVGGNMVPVSAQVPGTVIAILADDTDLVDTGATLLKLDDADAKIQLQAAGAALADAVRSARGLYASDSQARAGIAQHLADAQRSQHELERAEAELRRTTDELSRRESLYRQKFISGEALQNARTAVEAARASRDAANAALVEARSATDQARSQQAGTEGLVDRTSLETHPRVVAAAAKLRDAYLALSRTTLLAPVRGHVAKRSAQVGARVAAGAPLLSIIPDNQFWVDANFKEAELANIRIGQPVRLHSDLYGSDVEYHGTIAGIASGTGSVFSILPAQNASGNWIKIVQRLPVRIALTDEQVLKDNPLRLGLSMKVTVDTHQTDGALLNASPRQNPAYQTDIYASQTAAADALIERIIRANR